MSTARFLCSDWNWNPFLVGGWLAALALYAAVLGHDGKPDSRAEASEAARFTTPMPGRGRTKGWPFLTAIMVSLLALISPLATLADGYLLSAHLLQYALLLLAVPPLLLLSLPAWPEPGALGCNLWARMGRALTHPAVTWLVGFAALWVWHLPRWCNAALFSPPLHGLQVFSLLVAGGMFWWPVCGPQPNRRLSALTAAFYLLGAWVSCTFLGIVITFAPFNICPIFLHPVDRLGLLPLVREHWRLTTDLDQQMGRLLLWMPACALYLSVIIAILSKWLRAEQRKTLLETQGQAQGAPRSSGPSPTASSR